MQSSVKQRLIFLREYFQESEWHFAKRTGFTNAAFHKWEKEGASDPKPSSLRQISDATGCSYTWLKDGVGEMFPTAIETKASRPEAVKSSIPKGSLLAQIQQELAEINLRYQQVQELLGKSLGNRKADMFNLSSR